MDLRPKLAREFVRAIKDDLVKRHRRAYDSDVERWVKLIMERFISHDIPFPDGEHYGTRDKVAISAFLAKYPDIEKLISLTSSEAMRRWPQATFTLELNSDPESGHVCHEGQSLTLEINIGEDEYRKAHEEWLEWCCGDDSPYQKIKQKIGDVATLFNAFIR